jgi:hypothetical protein
MLVVDQRPDKKITGVKRIKDTLILSSESGRIKLEPKSAEIVRVVYTLKDTFSEQEKPGVIYKDVFSGWDYKETENEILLDTGKLSLRINIYI